MSHSTSRNAQNYQIRDRDRHGKWTGDRKGMMKGVVFNAVESYHAIAFNIYSLFVSAFSSSFEHAIAG